MMLPGKPQTSFDESNIKVNSNLDMLGVLIVMPNSELRQSLVRSFNQEGAKVLVAGRGSDALFILQSRNEQIRIIIADAVMPQMNGFQLLKKSKTINPSTINILLIDYSTPPDDSVNSEEKDYVLIPSDLGAESIFNKICNLI